MKSQAFTVISFGNYETKILITNLVNDKLLPVYKKTFLTKKFFFDSNIVDTEQLVESLAIRLSKIPIDIRKTKIIFNIPIKSLDIKESQSAEYTLNKNLTKNEWDRIWDIHCRNYRKNKKEFELDSKVFELSINNKNYWPIPFGKFVETLSFKSKHYYYNYQYIKQYKDIAKKLGLSNVVFLCDSLVVSTLFSNFEKKSKLLINIGHSESSIEFYENLVLYTQKPIKFGIKALTSKICEMANIDEISAINLLKMYQDLCDFDMELSLVNHFKEKFLEYTQTKIVHIATLINNWILDLLNIINESIQKIYSINFLVDEIYLNSATNFLKPYKALMEERLIGRMEIHCLEPNFMDIDEHKYISLMASILYYIKEIN